MGEMADLFLSSQDDIDFYDECAAMGDRVPAWALRMPTLEPERPFVAAPREHIPAHVGHRPSHKKRSLPKPRVCPHGFWVDKNGELQEISKMTDQYLSNLISFLENNPALIQQNSSAFECLIEERYKRRAYNK